MPQSDPTQSSTDLAITSLPIESLKPYPNNARKHPKKQVRDLAESIEAFGFLVPIGIDEDHVILSGHGRWAAAKLLGLERVPCIRNKGLTEAQKRAYVLADNKIPEGSTWIMPLLRHELHAISLPSLQCNAYPTGFTIPEIEALVQAPPPKPVKAKKTKEGQHDVPALMTFPQRCQTGDLWQIGPHRLICGEAYEAATLTTLMRGEKAALTFTDNVLPDPSADKGNPKQELVAMLTHLLKNINAATRKGSIHYLVLDWPEIEIFQAAGQGVYGALQDLIVWDTQTAHDPKGLYQSGHKLILAYQNNPADDAQNMAIPFRCHQRTNVWSYPEVTASSIQGNDEDIVIDQKPIPMLEEAIRDGSEEGDIILDPAGWSGSILIAAHLTGRRAYLCEWDPSYCDLILARAEKATGYRAELLNRKTENELLCDGDAA